MSLVHDQIIAQMRAREALSPPSALSLGIGRVLVGAESVFSLSAPPIRAKVAGTAAPSDVTLGLPSARDTVRVYANRLDGQIEKINAAWNAWLKVVIDKGTPLTTDEASFNGQWPGFFSKWKVFLASISSFDPFGPSPVNAWDQISSFDDQAEVFRQRLATFSGALAPPGAPNLGDQPSPVVNAVSSVGSALGSAVKWVFIGTVGLAGLALYLNHRERTHPSTASG